MSSTDCVKRGMDVLDSIPSIEGWRQRINLDIQMYVVEKCILGQLFGSFFKACEFFRNVHGYSHSKSWYVEHGFMADSIEDYKELGYTWKELIRGN